MLVRRRSAKLPSESCESSGLHQVGAVSATDRGAYAEHSNGERGHALA
jgi:hypothetical protein